MKFPKIIAHRGLSCEFPENSLIAFQKAIEIGADGVECDVHRTADDRIVIIHDSTIDRTTTGKGHVHQMSLDDIKEFDLLHDKIKNQKIPTLEEFLDLVAPSTVELRIEIKEVGFEHELVEKIKNCKLHERTTFISFLPMAICTVKGIDSSIRTSLLTSRFAQVRYDQIRNCLDGVDFEFGPELNRQMYDQARKDGLTLDFWTVDSLEDLKKALEWQPDYITTNYAQRILEVKHQRENS